MLTNQQKDNIREEADLRYLFLKTHPEGFKERQSIRQEVYIETATLYQERINEEREVMHKLANACEMALAYLSEPSNEITRDDYKQLKEALDTYNKTINNGEAA